jgi:hypothetical protein
MADVPLVTEPTVVADGVLAERVRRLEEQLATREAAPPADEEVARRVLTLLAEKAAQHRAQSAGEPPVPGLIPAAVTAARVAQTYFPAGPDAPPGAAAQPAETGFRAWLVTQVADEFRLIFRMYFDPRYRLSRVAQFGVPIVLALMVLNYFFVASLPVVGFLFERLLLIVLAVVLYRILAREVVRYRAVLDFLARFGHG